MKTESSGAGATSFLQGLRSPGYQVGGLRSKSDESPKSLLYIVIKPSHRPSKAAIEIQ